MSSFAALCLWRVLDALVCIEPLGPDVACLAAHNLSIVSFIAQDEDMVDMTASQQLRRSGRSRKLINQISDKDFGEWKDLQIEEPAEAEDSPASEVSDNEGWAEKKSPKQVCSSFSVTNQDNTI